MKNLVAAVVLALLTFGSQAGTAAPPSLTAANPIANHFIVQYHPDVSDAERRSHEDLVHTTASQNSSYRGIVKTFSIGNFQGYHVEMDAATLAVLQKSDIVSSLSVFRSSH